MALHHRLLRLPACTHCRCALPASLILSRTLARTSASSSLAPISLSAADASSAVRPKAAYSWKQSGALKGVSIEFSRSFSSRARTRVETARARLSEVSFTEEAGVQLTDQSVQAQGEADDKGVKRLPGSNIVITGADVGRLAQVKSAEFIKSSSKESECPHEGHPEIALVGRSNVGKSSLINAMVHRKELAQTSKKPDLLFCLASHDKEIQGQKASKKISGVVNGSPEAGFMLISVYLGYAPAQDEGEEGKTQLINHFLINNKWYLVDLPGYGFAKAPTAIRTDWNEFTKDYFLNRKTLISVLLLVDASIPPQKIDLDCIDWLGRKKIPVTIVFTKCDRKKKKKNGGRRPEENISEFLEKLKAFYDETPPWIMTSAETGQGRDELMRHLAQLRIYWAS